MKFYTMILGLFALLIAVSTASAQNINIHTAEGTTSFDLAEVDSITFSGEGNGEGPESGEEREFQLTEDVTITMCWIPAGEFSMGSPEDEQDRFEWEEPLHNVVINSGFWLSKYEFTQGQWEAVLGHNPSEDYCVGDEYPVYFVSFLDIQELIGEMNDGFRLPSEAEWEFACRAGTDSRFYWGIDANYEAIGDYAWYTENCDRQAHPVGEKRPNAWNYLTCVEMYGNGVKIAGMRVMRALQTMKLRGLKILKMRSVGSFEVGAGAKNLRTVDLPCDTQEPKMLREMVTVFV